MEIEQLEEGHAAEQLESSPEAVASDFAEYKKLYVSHFFRTWGDRLFEFAASLFIIDIFQTTLLESSLYGLLTTAFAIIFSNGIGKWVDKVPRLHVVTFLIPTQKLPIILSHVGFWALLTYYTPAVAHGQKSTPALVIFAFIILLGGIYQVATVGMNIAIERDWVVIIAGQNSTSLTKLNATLRRIDLFCKMVAPLFVALLTSTASTLVAVYFIGAWNVVSMFIEYFCIYRVYQAVPALKLPKRPKEISNDRQSLEFLKARWQDVNKCLQSPILLASISYSMLYLTVLSMGGTMIAYLVAKDYSTAIVSAIRAVCVVAGLAATFIGPFLTSRLGLIRCGLWSVWSQVFCLVPVVIAFYINSGKGVVPTVLLFVGMALSRIGLWSFDLAETQIIQEGVPSEEVGLINGFQFSLCNVFDMLGYATTIIWSNPDSFYIPATISFGMVGGAAVVFSAYCKQTRGHLLHFRKLVDVKMH